MKVEDFLIELKASLRSYDKRDMIDDASVYHWVETALKKFGGDIAMPKEAVIDVKRGQAVMPGDYFTLILAFRCDFAGYEVPEGKEIIPRLQNTIAWKERTTKSYKWNSCEECCKDECESVVVEKFYINTRDLDKERRHEVLCRYRNPRLLRLAPPMQKDLCLSKCRNLHIRTKDVPDEINIAGGILYANFDGPVYMQYKATPYDDKGNIWIPDTSTNALADYVENYVKMRFFEELAFNGEAPGAAELFKLYVQQDPVKFMAAKTDVKMDQLTTKGVYKMKNKIKESMVKYELMTPQVDKIFKII